MNSDHADGAQGEVRSQNSESKIPKFERKRSLDGEQRTVNSEPRQAY